MIFFSCDASLIHSSHEAPMKAFVYIVCLHLPSKRLLNNLSKVSKIKVYKLILLSIKTLHRKNSHFQYNYSLLKSLRSACSSQISFDQEIIQANKQQRKEINYQWKTYQK